MTDREFVESVWENVLVIGRDDKWSSLPFLILTDNFRLAGPCLTEAEACCKAAEFTRETLEQVRQVREEIEFIKEDLADFTIMEFTDGICAIYRRILSRLEAELARLTAGMKPEATA